MNTLGNYVCSLSLSLVCWMLLAGCGTNTTGTGVDSRSEEVKPADAAPEIACFGTACVSVAGCPEAPTCVSKVSCAEGCCVYEYAAAGTPCQEGCGIDGQCSESGHCEDTVPVVCPDKDGNPCTVSWCDPTTGKCADDEEVLPDGDEPMKSHCWSGIVCWEGEVDTSDATPTELQEQCEAESALLSPFGCIDEIVCVDSSEECVPQFKEDGLQCWSDERSPGDECGGRSCTAGECKVDPSLDEECTEDDYPPECENDCRQCTTLSCAWIPDPAKPDSADAKVRYCKPEVAIGNACDDSDPCTVEDYCVLGSQTEGPLGKETLGACEPGETKSKEDCIEELGKPALDCIMAAVGCDAAKGGCHIDQDKADAWCLSTCPCCNQSNTFCDHKNPTADEFGCVSSYYPEGTPCDDGNECTEGDQCVTAVEDSAYLECVGVPVDLDDGNDCTVDTCHPDTGEKHEWIEGCVEPCKFEGEVISEECGNCGHREKVCPEAGVPWDEIPWGACLDEGCPPGDLEVQGCGNCGQQERICTDSCDWPAWGACQDEGPCVPGLVETQSCGVCMIQTHTCDDDCNWGDWSECTDEGACSPGETESQDCGLCGTQTKTCNADCQWNSWGPCAGEGVCPPGDQQNQTCGSCGTMTKSCQSNCQWGNWGSCVESGVCTPGETQSQECGNCGTQTRTCNSSCQWGSWSSCQGQGQCPPGNTDSQSCGNCGSKTKTCNSGCQWSSWGSCVGQGPCTPGQTQTCNCGTQTCSGSCQWGTCTKVCGEEYFDITPAVGSWTQNFTFDNDCSCSDSDPKCRSLYRGKITSVNGNKATLEFTKTGAGGGPSKNVHYWLVVSGEESNCNKLGVYFVRQEGTWYKDDSVLTLSNVNIWPTLQECKDATESEDHYKAFFIITGGGDNPDQKWWFQKDRLFFYKDCP